ncbi:cilia- and flagella-associated protein 157-like [Dicentrarchus labrax]|uniref:Cilia- and flagella-associated protein 157 n=1 Tax=Dicentrarchus labrax TaxID=13489 RepID=A0A8P4KNE1_DICLA|nr:cilia- and flagella-associated protein 157-like [Dicentrarchus labrax]
MGDEISPEEREKSLYVTQIRHLDEQLKRCQLKCDELEKQNKDLASQYSVVEEDKKDIAEYLKYAVAAKEKEVNELTERLESLQQADKQDREALKLYLSQQRQELQERFDELNSQSIKQEEHKEQIMQLMQQLSKKQSLEEQLVSQKEEHEAATCSMRTDAAFERDKLSNEIQSKVDAIINTKASDIIQKERAQRSEWVEQFHLLLHENVDLWEERYTLEAKQGVILCQIGLLREDINSDTMESFIHKREVGKQTNKCQQLEVNLKGRSAVHKRTLAREEELRKELASASEECRQKSAEASQLGAELQWERSRRRELEGIIWEAVVILRHIMEDSEKASNTQRKKKWLLEVLEKAAPKETGPALKVSTEESSQGQTPQTTEAKPASAETLNRATDPLFLLARYRPGDLGLIPRPTWKHKPAVSTSTKWRLNRKPCSKKTGTTASEPKPVNKDECFLSHCPISK